MRQVARPLRPSAAYQESEATTLPRHFTGPDGGILPAVAGPPRRFMAADGFGYVRPTYSAVFIGPGLEGFVSAGGARRLDRIWTQTHHAMVQTCARGTVWGMGCPSGTLRDRFLRPPLELGFVEPDTAEATVPEEVTVVWTRQARPGCQAALENVIERLGKTMATAPGYAGLSRCGRGHGIRRSTRWWLISPHRPISMRGCPQRFVVSYLPRRRGFRLED